MEFSYRLVILKAVSVHLQNDLFEFFLHGGNLAAEVQTRGKIKGCDIGCALVAYSREEASSVDTRTVTAFRCDRRFRCY